MQNPVGVQVLRDFEDWKEKCNVDGQPYCSLPNPCPLTTRELPGETFRQENKMKRIIKWLTLSCLGFILVKSVLITTPGYWTRQEMDSASANNAKVKC